MRSAVAGRGQARRNADKEGERGIGPLALKPIDAEARDQYRRRQGSPGRAGTAAARTKPMDIARGAPSECLFCDARLPATRMPDHVVTLHRERLEAATRYQRVLAAGGTVELARAAANAYLRRRLESATGRYVREGHA